MDWVFKLIFVPFTFIEKVYWYLWRKNQFIDFNKIGGKVWIGRHCKFTNYSIDLGNNIYIGEGCRFQATNSKIIIGNDVMFGPNVSIHGGNHKKNVIGKLMKEIKDADKTKGEDGDVVIGNDVWIGSNVIILSGVTIGDGTVIAAGSIVSKSIGDYKIFIPKIVPFVKERFNEEELKTHLNKIGSIR